MSPCCPPRPLHAAPATAEPLLLQFKRAPASSTMHCYRTRTTAPPHAPAASVRFLDIRDSGAGGIIFSYADTRERWAQITHSVELGGAVLDAPSLGLLQIPLSTYLDDMTALFPRSGGAFSMRTRYGCQKWFRVPPRSKDGAATTAVTLRAVYPQHADASDSVASALTLVAQELSTPSNHYQPPHFLPSDADPNLFAQWPFSFAISAVYQTADDFTLEIALSDLPASAVLVREASIDLIHAAVLAAYTINQSIWSQR